MYANTTTAQGGEMGYTPPRNVLRRLIPLTGVLIGSAAFAHAQFWPQWALTPQHSGQVPVAGQPLNQILANIVYDPLVPAEMADRRRVARALPGAAHRQRHESLHGVQIRYI